MALTFNEFVDRIREQGAVWGLCNDDDAWAIHEDPDEHEEVMPVWVDEQSARACAVDEWADYVPTKIDLADFIDNWLPALQEDAVWIGINFSASEQGDDVDPEDLLDALAGRN